MSATASNFVDRADAGRQLAQRLSSIPLAHPVVYALPRGGVPVAAEVARALKAPLDLVLVRKIGAPGAPELALGAIVDGNRPQTVINEDVRRQFGVDDAWLERAQDRELAEIERRRVRYYGGRAQIAPKGRTAVLVDDGLATGATMKAAVTALQRQAASKVVIAVPVAAADALPPIEDVADLVICLRPEKWFRGVGGYYDDFHQLTDEETIGLLREAWSEDPSRR
ncbi:MAG: phosphoribosyltransferase [Bauldia sp.]|nr:phosphoribosyltransferase [Bauldia sp.]